MTLSAVVLYFYFLTVWKVVSKALFTDGFLNLCGILVFTAQEGLVPCAVKSWEVMVPTRFSFSDPSLLHLLHLFIRVLPGGRGKGGSLCCMRDWKVGSVSFFFCPVCFLFRKSEAGCILVDSLFEDRSFPGSQLPRKQILIKNQSDKKNYS